MTDYPFRLVHSDREAPLEDTSLLLRRPFAALSNSFADDAKRFVSGEQLEIAVNTAIAVGEPLLITGEPGTGKTQAAYYAAYQLGVEPVLHFQVKSDSSARDLLYHFDTVRYFHDAHLRREGEPLNKAEYVEPRDLWKALVSDTPRVLLIDEIDKAPRDFPNDLLHELDQLQSEIAASQSVTRLETRARELGFVPAGLEQVEYFKMTDYPATAPASSAPQADELPDYDETLASWFAGRLQAWNDSQHLPGQAAP